MRDQVLYSGAMYPNVPIAPRVAELPTSVSFVKPKSATCNTEVTQRHDKDNYFYFFVRY